MGKRPTCLTEIYHPPPVKKSGKETLLFVDCFARYFEPENARAARGVLEAGGYTGLEETSSRPPFCGPAFLTPRTIDQARGGRAPVGRARSAHPPSAAPLARLESSIPFSP